MLPAHHRPQYCGSLAFLGLSIETSLPPSSSLLSSLRGSAFSETDRKDFTSYTALEAFHQASSPNQEVYFFSGSDSDKGLQHFRICRKLDHHDCSCCREPWFVLHGVLTRAACPCCAFASPSRVCPCFCRLSRERTYPSSTEPN